MTRPYFKNKSILLISQTGCLLPLMILFNLFFGWMFFKPLTWVSVEGILILLFIINSYVLARKISSSASSLRRSNVVDVEGEVVEKEDQIKSIPKR